MTTPNPITPPPELVQDWAQKAQLLTGDDPVAFAGLLCNKAARWGADQELEACCEWLHWQNLATHSELIPSLRAARHPKPPSLKELALDRCNDYIDPDGIIRRALEALPDD